MNLGQLIARLEELPPDMLMDGLEMPHSYRGYYVRLAFVRRGPMLVCDVLKLAKSCVGQTYCGYKGGEYTMGPESLVHIVPFEYMHDDDTLLAGLSPTGALLSNYAHYGLFVDKRVDSEPLKVGDWVRHRLGGRPMRIRLIYGSTSGRIAAEWLEAQTVREYDWYAEDLRPITGAELERLKEYGDV